MELDAKRFCADCETVSVAPPNGRGIIAVQLCRRHRAAPSVLEAARALLVVADRRMAKLGGKATFRILTGLDLEGLREAVAREDGGAR